MQPSASSTMRVAYWWASSGLCVTIMTRRSRATSRNRSMTCTLVAESRAPVGSSASRISGSLMRARDGDTLHLAARHLRGLLVDVVLQADAFKGIEGTLAALGAGDTGQGEGQLDVGQDALVRDQVVGLEDEADAVVAVGVPVARLVVLRGDAVDDEVAALEAVEASDDVEHRRLAGARLAQNSDEFVVTERHRDLVERHLHQVGGLVGLDDLLEL